MKIKKVLGYGILGTLAFAYLGTLSWTMGPGMVALILSGTAATVALILWAILLIAEN